MSNSLKDPDKSYRYRVSVKEILVCSDLALVRLVWTLTVVFRDGRAAETIEEPQYRRHSPPARWLLEDLPLPCLSDCVATHRESAMILSKRHKFIFIKGVKVGGTSIEIALAPFCGPDDIITPITPIDELRRLACGAGARNYLQDRAAELAYLEALKRTAIADLGKLQPPTSEYFSHMWLSDVLRFQGPAVQDYQVVGVERHPYAKIISWANHQLSFSAYQNGAEMRSDLQALKAFLKKAVDDRRILAARNIDRYRDMNGLIAARIIRYEYLEGDFRKFMASLGIEYRSTLPHAKQGILSNSVDPREFFEDSEIALINELFREEFETFNYAAL